MPDCRQINRIRPVLFLVALIAGAGCGLISGCSDPFRKAEPLDISSYATSANRLRGNTYKLEAEVLTLLAWSPSGRLISVGMDDGNKALPVVLSNEFDSLNVQKGQKLKILVTVDEKGVLRATKLVKL